MSDRRRIFVFGSNTAGRHGKGAALFAKEHYGAISGKGWGLQGESFGIPTKDARLQPLPLKSIRVFVEEFKAFARVHPEMDFDINSEIKEYIDATNLPTEAISADSSSN